RARATSTPSTSCAPSAGSRRCSRPGSPRSGTPAARTRTSTGRSRACWRCWPTPPPRRCPPGGSPARWPPACRARCWCGTAALTSPPPSAPPAWARRTAAPWAPSRPAQPSPGSRPPPPPRSAEPEPQASQKSPHMWRNRRRGLPDGVISTGFATYVAKPVPADSELQAGVQRVLAEQLGGGGLRPVGDAVGEGVGGLGRGAGLGGAGLGVAPHVDDQLSDLVELVAPEAAGGEGGG